MPITYTNRKGQTYYLCQGTTKTGRSRYYFAREPKDTVVSAIPDGYQVQESVNGIVSLAKTHPRLLSDNEINSVKAAIQVHPQARAYRVDSKAKQITIYERVGPDLMELAAKLTADFGIGIALDKAMMGRMQEEERLHSQFTPIMRFILMDEQKRLFKAQRMCFRGAFEGWRDIEYSKPIAKLAAMLIPTLGTEEFFELF